MNSPGLFVDTNLLVLFVTGNVDEEIIGRHRRLREFTQEDYELLDETLAPYERILVTPNTLTETSNLLSQHADPERSRLLETLRFLIQHTEEIVVASVDASAEDEFERLGLADAALLHVATPETPVITADFDLYFAIAQRQADAVVNFRHLQAS